MLPVGSLWLGALRAIFENSEYSDLGPQGLGLGLIEGLRGAPRRPRAGLAGEKRQIYVLSFLDTNKHLYAVRAPCCQRQEANPRYARILSP